MKTAKMIFAATLIGALCVTAPVLAETDEPESIVCNIEDGNYVIRIPDAEGDLGWMADDMEQDDSVVKLGSAELVDDEFVIVYEPAGDGEITVSAKHYNGIACDRMHTWDLRVENGAVTENFGGSYTESPKDDELDPFMTGEWVEKDTEYTGMSIERNPEKGFDIEIVSPMTHGAYVFKTTIYFDCDRNAFVYDKGKFWDLPEDGNTEAELGEAKIAGSTGSISMEGDEDNLSLVWYDDGTEGEEIVFTRQAAF